MHQPHTHTRTGTSTQARTTSMHINEHELVTTVGVERVAVILEV